MPKATPAPSSRGAIVSSTRFFAVLHSQRVLSSGTSARQSPHRTVRAQRYATAGFATQRGFASFSRWNESNSALSEATDTRPSLSGSSSFGDRDR